MFKTLFRTAVFTLICSSVTFSQVNLHQIFSRAVREGISVGTHVDSLLIHSTINAGNLQTRLTIVAQPLAYTRKTKPKPRIITTDSGKVVIKGNDTLVNSTSATLVDSVEMTLNFSLPTDYAADSMWLWVGGTPVDAYIQDRALASSQYRSIVGTRKDPAILQYNGNGNYNLRIFPAKSLESRKIAIQFHHTFDDNISKVISTTIPVVFDSSFRTNYYEATPKIGFVNALFSTNDPIAYNVKFEGVGSGVVSNSVALSLTSTNVTSLKPCFISADDPSGQDEFLNVSTDKITGSTIAGISMTIADNNVIFENEPEVRIIALDIKNAIWNWNDYYAKRAKHLGQSYTQNSNYIDYNVLERAQKYAVLCLEHYLDKSKKFNVVFGGNNTTTLFDTPVPAHPEYIKKAVEAILKMTPNGSSSTKQVVETAVKQADEGIVLLISDLFEPYNYYILKSDSKIRTPGTEAIAYNSDISYINNLVDSTGVVLFTVDDNNRLSEVSYKSGGYRLGGLLNRYNIDYYYTVINGKRLTIPTMPSLFGSRNNSGLRKIEITSNSLSDLVHTKDGYTYNYWHSNALIETSIINGVSIPRDQYNPSSTLLRISGVSSSLMPKQVLLTVKGRLGGLKFHKTVTASSLFSSASSSGEVMWAFRKSEMLAQGNYTSNAPAIKEIGKQYHIITRQTSLLALEPGMQLWEDTLVATQETQPTTVREKGVTYDAKLAMTNTASVSATGTGIDFDGLSLTDLIQQYNSSGVAGVPLVKKRDILSARAHGGMIFLSVPPSSDDITLQLFDLKGSLLIKKIINKKEISGLNYTWNINDETIRLSRGFYMLHVKTNNKKLIVTVPFLHK